MILENAAHFFAAHGYAAGLRDLARHAGISPSLVLRYFGTKDELVRRVFDEIVSNRWNREWSVVLRNHQIPLRTRLKEFYRWFMEVADDYDYVRCGIYSGLEGVRVGNEHFETNIERYMKLIAVEIRAANGITDDSPPSSIELERVWMLHGTFVNYLTRKHVHARAHLPDWRDIIDSVVDLFLDGALQTNTAAERKRKVATR